METARPKRVTEEIGVSFVCRFCTDVGSESFGWCVLTNGSDNHARIINGRLTRVNASAIETEPGNFDEQMQILVDRESIINRHGLPLNASRVLRNTHENQCKS